MVKRKSRPQTNLKFDTLLRLNKPMSYGNWFGSENYSGKKIPWTEMSVWVRVSLGVLSIFLIQVVLIIG